MLYKHNENTEAVMMGNELVMLNVETGKYVVINEIGKEIWDRIDGVITVDGIISDLLDDYDIDGETCSLEVNRFFDQMVQEGLIVKG